MIIKIWRYSINRSVKSRPRKFQQDAFDLVCGCGHYIHGFEIEPNQLQIFETAIIDDEVAPDAMRSGAYVIREDDHDVTGSKSHGLGDGDTTVKIRKLAVAAAAAGLEHFYHYTWSHRNGEIFEPHELARQNQVIRQVLEASDCPALEAYHREQRGPKKNEPQVHGHGNLLSVDGQGKGKPLAYGWYKEALQIAIAVIERNDGLRPEPLRRNIATEEGVFNFLTGVKIADRGGLVVRSLDPKRVDLEGRQLPDGALMKQVREAHNAIIYANEPPPGIEPGAERSLVRYVEIVVAPRIKAAKDWPEIHRTLAPLGIRYVKVGNTGRLVALGKNGEPTGQWVAAGAAYPRAALGKLVVRFKKSAYEPPQEKLDLRPLTMPVFNRIPEGSDVGTAKETVAKQEAVALKAEIAALEMHLAQEDKLRRQGIRDANLAAGYNRAIAEQARRRQAETEIVREFAVKKGAKRARKKPEKATQKNEQPKGWRQVRLLIWGLLRSKKQTRKGAIQADLQKRYEIEDNDGTIEYWLRTERGGRVIAFVESDILITVRHTSRQVNEDALRIASERYTCLRVTGTKRSIGDTVKIAAELGLTLEGEQREAAQEHTKAIAEGKAASIIQMSRRFHQTSEVRKKARKDVFRTRRQFDSTPTGADLSGRNTLFHSLVRNYHSNIARSHAGLNDPVIKEARRKLRQDINHDRLWLASSRYSQRYANYYCRYLDDPRLLQAFARTPEYLVDPMIQRSLRAIEAVHLEKRHWIASAIVAGAASVNDGKLTIMDAGNHWAHEFYKLQSGDTTFQRLITVARARPERFPFNAHAQPGERALQKTKASGDRQLASAIAKEMRYGMAPETQRPGVQAGGTAHNPTARTFEPKSIAVQQVAKDNPGQNAPIKSPSPQKPSQNIGRSPYHSRTHVEGTER